MDASVTWKRSVSSPTETRSSSSPSLARKGPTAEARSVAKLDASQARDGLGHYGLNRVLLEPEQLLLSFKQIATLQLIDVEPVANHDSDFAAGAARSRELGMRRLAERLEKLATE